MGLILGGLISGLGAGAGAAADSLERSRQIEEERAARAEERRLDREARNLDRQAERESREALLRERLDYSRERDSARGTGTRSTSGGGTARGGGGVDEARENELISARTGMSVPEVEQFRRANRTGNFLDEYGVDQAMAAPDDDLGGSAQRTERVLPPGFSQFVEERRKLIGRELEAITYGKDYDEVEKGRAAAGDNEVRGLITGASKPEDDAAAARKLHARAGKGEWQGGSTGSSNEFTGESKLNPLGNAKVGTEKSAQAENAAQAGKARAGADADRALAEKRRAGGDDGEMTNDQLNRAIETARKELDSAQKAARDAPTKEREAKAGEISEIRARLRRLQAIQDNRIGGKTPEPAAAPKASDGKRAPNAIASPKTKAEYDALPSGAKYKDPNGVVRTKN